MVMLECLGRVEVKSGARTILCDKMRVDMQKKFIYMEMKNPAETVNVYSLAATGSGGEVIMAPKTLKMNMVNQELEAGGPMKTKTFTGAAPSNRGTGPSPEEALKGASDKDKKGSLFNGERKPK